MFVKGHGVVAETLVGLPKKKQFSRNLVAGVAFQKLKVAMSETLVLTLPVN